LLGIGAVEEVVVEWAGGGGEAVLVGALAAEVKEGAEGVVKEDADGAAGVHFEEERNRLVDGVCGLLPTEAVGVPHGESFAVAVEGAGLVAEAEEMVVEGLGLGDGEAVGREGDGEGVGLEDVAVEIGDGEAEVGGDGDAQARGAEGVGLGCDGNARGAGVGEYGPGRVFSGMAVGEDANAEDVGSESVDSQGEGGVGEFDAGGSVGGGGEIDGALRCEEGREGAGEESGKADAAE